MADLTREIEKSDLYINPDEYFRQMLELYTMLPPSPFRKLKKESDSDGPRKEQEINENN